MLNESAKNFNDFLTIDELKSIWPQNSIITKQIWWSQNLSAFNSSLEYFHDQIHTCMFNTENRVQKPPSTIICLALSHVTYPNIQSVTGRKSNILQFIKFFINEWFQYILPHDIDRKHFVRSILSSRHCDIAVPFHRWWSPWSRNW